MRLPLSIARSVFETADAAATFCPVLGSNFVLLLESLRRARVAEAPKARLDFFRGADFIVLGSTFFFGGRRSGVHGDARNDDQVAIFDAPVLDGGVRYASSVFCPVCFETQENA